jgi:site-specific recombinase
VLIQMLHFTVATKQPAMTAPAMAAKLKDIQSDGSIQEFVDEVAHLVRSQVAAILGNVLIVFPGRCCCRWAMPILSGTRRSAPRMRARCWTR